MEKPFGLVVPDYRKLGIEGPYIGDSVWKELERLDGGFDYVPASIIPFSDGSEKVVAAESVRGKEAYAIHSLYLEPSKHTLIGAQICDMLRRADAKEVILMDCYNPYFRQDYRTSREPLTARIVANLYHGHGANTVFTCDPHSPQLDLAFEKLESLRISGHLAKYFQERYDTSNCMVSPPDEGGYKRASRFAKALGLPLAVLRKERYATDKVRIEKAFCDVEGKDVIIRDDILGTGGTIIEAVKALRDGGANKIYACVTHLGLYGDAKKMLAENDIMVIGTNTIPQTFSRGEERYFDIFDISGIIAEVIYRRANGLSINEFFRESTK
ncbi:MAG: ribose-phosphate pyrophosphokinase [Candidatus Aenigmarchaeota archaeon]|nr:ribose-phosphate pyrophosphokinase [Candidatus Aenigmarchaeota archaeon]